MESEASVSKYERIKNLSGRRKNMSSKIQLRRQDFANEAAFQKFRKFVTCTKKKVDSVNAAKRKLVKNNQKLKRLLRVSQLRQKNSETENMKVFFYH